MIRNTCYLEIEIIRMKSVFVEKCLTSPVIVMKEILINMSTTIFIFHSLLYEFVMKQSLQTSS